MACGPCRLGACRPYPWLWAFPFAMDLRLPWCGWFWALALPRPFLSTPSIQLCPLPLALLGWARFHLLLPHVQCTPMLCTSNTRALSMAGCFMFCCNLGVSKAYCVTWEPSRSITLYSWLNPTMCTPFFFSSPNDTLVFTPGRTWLPGPIKPGNEWWVDTESGHW